MYRTRYWQMQSSCVIVSSLGSTALRTYWHKAGNLSLTAGNSCEKIWVTNPLHTVTFLHAHYCTYNRTTGTKRIIFNWPRMRENSQISTLNVWNVLWAMPPVRQDLLQCLYSKPIYNYPSTLKAWLRFWLYMIMHCNFYCVWLVKNVIHCEPVTRLNSAKLTKVWRMIANDVFFIA